MASLVNLLIGKNKEEAERVLHGKDYRIVKEDNKYYIITRDVKPDRYNLQFIDGKVDCVWFG